MVPLNPWFYLELNPEEFTTNPGTSSFYPNPCFCPKFNPDESQIPLRFFSIRNFTQNSIRKNPWPIQVTSSVCPYPCLYPKFNPNHVEANLRYLFSQSQSMISPWIQFRLILGTSSVRFNPWFHPESNSNESKAIWKSICLCWIRNDSYRNRNRFQNRPNRIFSNIFQVCTKFQKRLFRA